MPKGDREIFKADIDDGYTKVANLLLEALAMAKLNGVQKGICLFVLRRTYGWGSKEGQISLKEFALACNSSETYVSKQIKQLVTWKVILRTSYEPGKVPSFTVNTRVAQWDKGCLNVQGLNDCIRQGLFKWTRVPLSDQTRVDQGSDLEPQGIEPPLKKDLKKVKESTLGDTGVAKEIVPPDNGHTDPKEKHPGIIKPQAFKYLELIDTIETLELTKQISHLVVAYNACNPEQYKQYGAGGSIKAHQEFKKAVEDQQVPARDILIEILYDQEEDVEPKPWDIVNALVHQRGLEKTWAHVIYDLDIRGPTDARTDTS